MNVLADVEELTDTIQHINSVYLKLIYIIK